MSKVHITLVGGQPAPVYNGILATMPDRVVYVCSNESREETEHIRNEIVIESEIIEIPPSEMQEIDIAVRTLFDKYNHDELTVNLSGGAKLWLVQFYSAFSIRDDALLFFIDQNNRLWNLKTKQSSILNFNPDKLFTIQGTPLHDFRKISDYNDEDDAVIPLIERARIFSSSEFNRLCTLLDDNFDNRLKNMNNDTFVTSKGSYVSWDKLTEEVEIHLIKGYREWCNTLSSPNIINLVFHSGWFEYKIASLFRDRYNDIRLNCLFEAKDMQTKNEVDIIINTGVKLIFVECKTKLSKITDIDKFHSVVKNYGGMGSKALFITDTPMSGVALEKCKDNDVLVFSLQEHLHIKEDLYTLLDNELNKINKR